MMGSSKNWEERIMATLEQVEKLRERADISFEEAKNALEACNDDLLDAIIYLEKQGKVGAPGDGGYYSSGGGYYSGDGHGAAHEESGGSAGPRPGTFSQMMKRFGRFLIKIVKKGNSNFFEVEKNGDILFTLPATALALLIICFFWITLPLLILGMFFGFHYHFRGSDLGRESVNKAMDDASNTVEDIKKSFKGEDRQSL